MFQDDDPRGVVREHVPKLGNILVQLDAAVALGDMDVPGLGFIRLKGEWKGFWAMTVRANWRLVFRFEEGNALDVDYVDYH